CPVDQPFTISNGTDDPIVDQAALDLSANDNTACVAPFNGNATATVTGGSGTYSYAWALASAPAATIDTDAILSNVEAGNYVLIVTDDVTGCTSATSSVTIGETLAPISIETTLLSIDYSCNPVTPTGSLRGQITGGGAGNTGFTFEWYQGTSATGTIINSTTDAANTISNLAPGSYTILVRDNTTQCTETATIVVPEDNPTIGANITKNSDQNVCFPADGQATVAPSFNFPLGVSTGFSASYTYQWYAGQNTNNPLAGEVNATLSQVTSGFYTVVVTETSSGCISNPATIEILDSTPAAPTINIVADAIPGSCNATGGEISATISGGTGPFNFFWYEGSDDFANDDPTGAAALTNGSALIASPNPTVTVTTSPTIELDNLVGGLYTLVVEDGSGCRHQSSFDLPFNGIQTTTTLNVINVSQCPDNGQADVSLADNQVITVSGQIGGLFTTLEPYTTSNGATGIISVDQGGTIQLSLTSGALVGGGLHTITGTSSGASATIDVVNSVGYIADEADDIEEYIIFLYAGSGVPVNRLAAYDVVNSVGTTLRFPYKFDPITGDIDDGDDNLVVNVGAVATGGTVTFTSLPAGPYTAIAREKASAAFGGGFECWSTSASDIIEQEAYKPIISAVNITSDSFCNVGTGNGSIAITGTKESADSDGINDQPNNFQFEIFDSGMVPLANAGNQSDVTNTTFTNLNAGETYFITVTRLGLAGPATNGCDTTASYTIPLNEEVHEITTPSVTANSDCSPLDGAIMINDSDLTDNAADYFFTWYTAYTDAITNTPLGNGFVDGGNNGDQGVNSVSGLVGGTYFVEVTHATKGCSSPVTSVVVDDERVNPAISVAATAQDISCDDDATNPATGQATAAIDNLTGGADIDDYIFTWYLDNPPTDVIDITDPGMGQVTFSGNGASGNTANAQAGVNIIDGLPAGTYFVQAEDLTNPGDGCTSAVQTVVIEQFTSTISVGNIAATDFNIQPNQDCSPSNGAYEILRITESRPAGPVTNTTMADYQFDWLESDRATTIAIGTFPDVTFPNGASGSNGASAIAGLPNGTYYVQITNTAETGCTQTLAEFVEFIIDDERVSPIINLASGIIEDTFCDNGANVGDGEISISIIDEGIAGTPTDFTITWYRGTAAAANEIFPTDGGTQGSATSNADFTTISNLAKGDYTVVVTKDLGDTPANGNVGCAATAVYNVGSMLNIPTLNESAIQARTEPDSTCVGIGDTGTITINDSDIDGTLDEYVIQVRQGSASGGHVGASPYAAGSGSPSLIINGLAADDYFVIATHDVRGCAAATAIINVKDSTRNPQVALISMTPDQDCGGGVNAGGLEVLVDGQFDHTDHFTFLWEVAGGGAVGVTDSESTLSGAAAGDYQVTVTNNNTNCSIVRTYTITNVPLNPSISNFTVGDNNICDDDNDGNPVDAGTFELLEATFDGATLNQAAMAGFYRLEVYEDQLLTSPVIDGDGDNTNFIYTELSGGNYFAIVRKLDSDCTSEPAEFDVIDNVLRPVVNIALQAADSTCTAGATPNGSLLATATVGATSGITDADADYTFQWYIGSGTGTPLANGVDPGNGSTPAGVATSSISGLSADTYTVEVTRLSTGCVTLEEFILPNVPTNVEITTVSIVDATNCTPGNGIITVTGVNRDNVTDYNFDYYNQDPNLGAAGIVFTGNAGVAYTVATAGTYWVVGTNTLVNCTTPAFEVQVGENLAYPAIELDAFDFQANCDPSNPNGRLLVLADGQAENATYDFEWYFGTGTGNTLTPDDYTGGANLTGASTNEVSGLAAGFYTVEVTNNVTGCVTIETYEMVDDIPNPVVISTSTSANTNCVNPNGQVAVSVVSPAPGRSVSDYSYYWFIGDLATVGTNPNPANADFTGSLIQNLSDGDYVVLVIDQIDNFCQSEAKEVTVEDGTRRPTFLLTTSDVTVCFDDKNGFAQVNVPDLSSVDIAWFNDTNTLIGNTFFVDSLDAGMYRLQLTHVITGCISEESFEILNNAVTPNDPFVLVNNGRNNCQFANGSAIANVDGVTNNFLFEWFDPSDMNTPYATGSEVFNLDTTTYLVRATNIATGCQSAFTSVDIGYEVVDPVYEVIFNNSVCLRTEDGSTNQFTGTAIVGFEEFQLASEYEWRDASGTVVGNDSRLIDAYPGDYTVTFTAENGCSYSASFTIETSLNIYNGVSANADGKNDFFLIDCIDYFPNNNVQVYNRAGQKIYDIDGYNNTSIRFEGFSNVGGGGLKLPSGTYFYIIDLGNGEDPVQGYLELVR
ncbi:MAG: gliding motility-associated C-terminal domain-containing protein, partial [Ekhidna sp.]